MTIERAAKAIRDSYEDALGEEEGKEWGFLARAALGAIAEPTPEMIEAGIDYLDGRHWAPEFSEMARNVWRAMHAAMLKGKKE